MLNGPQSPRNGGTAPSSTLRKPTSSSRLASRPVLAAADNTSPTDSRKALLRSIGALPAATAGKESVGTSRTVPSTLGPSGITARKASGSVAVGAAGRGDATEPRRARRSSTAEKEKAIGAAGQASQSRSTAGSLSSSRLPPSVSSTATKRAAPSATPSKRVPRPEATKDTAEATPRARRVASGTPATEPRTACARRSVGAGDMGPPPPPSASAKKSSVSSIGRGIPARPIAASTTTTAPSARRASRSSLSSSTSRPPRQTPSRPLRASRIDSSLSASTSRAAVPPLKRSSSIPIAASGSVRMAKTSSGISSQSIEEEHGDGTRSGKSSAASVASTSRLGRSTTSSARPPAPQEVNRSPTRLPTRKVDNTKGARLETADKKADTEIRPAPQLALAASHQSDRRDSWETLPPSGRPSLSGAPRHASHGFSSSHSRPDSHDSASGHEGDVSWETVASRRASALDASTTSHHDSFQTPRKASQPSSFGTTCHTEASSLPSRADMSYLSPEVSALSRALTAHHISIVHSSTSPSAAASSVTVDPRRSMKSSPAMTIQMGGRKSVTLDEVLKASLVLEQTSEGDEDGWLYEEGVSRVMRADLDGVSTPLKRSVLGAPILEEQDCWGQKAEEARNRVRSLEKDLEARSAQLAEERAGIAEERQRWQQEAEQLRRATAATAARHQDDLRRWEEERLGLASRPSIEDDLQLQLKSHQASSAHSSLLFQLEGIARSAKGEREELSSALDSLRLISQGLSVWQEVLSV